MAKSVRGGWKGVHYGEIIRKESITPDGHSRQGEMEGKGKCVILPSAMYKRTNCYFSYPNNLWDLWIRRVYHASDSFSHSNIISGHPPFNNAKFRFIALLIKRSELYRSEIMADFRESYS